MTWTGMILSLSQPGKPCCKRRMNVTVSSIDYSFEYLSLSQPYGCKRRTNIAAGSNYFSFEYLSPYFTSNIFLTARSLPASKR